MIKEKIKLYTLFFILFCSATAFSQVSRINISIKNDGKNTLPIGTAVLYGLPDSIIIGTKTIKENQFFDVKNQQSYFLKITAAGMQTLQENISIKDSAVNLIVKWQTKTNDLDNVTVLARKALITQEDDKTIVDAEVLANSSSNAYEVLEKVPGAIVDQDGNVYLNSSTPATVHINGREVKLSATDLASLLKSLPANSVSKIEILRTPSAKYDAGSSGGIVNIVLKKGVKLGTNGSVNFGYFQGKYATLTAGVNLNRSIKKVNTTLNYQYTDRNNFEELNSKRYISRDNSLVNQKAYTKYPGTNHYLSGGVDIALNEKWTVGYSSRLSNNSSRSYALNEIDLINQTNQTLLGKTQSIISNSGPAWFWNNELFAKWEIDSLGSELEIEADYDYSNNRNTQLYKNELLSPYNSFISGDGNTNNKKNIWEIDANLIVKLKYKYTLETGAKIIKSSSRNAAIYYAESNSGRKLDSFQTNQFRYKEQISSAYLQLSKTFYG